MNKLVLWCMFVIPWLSLIYLKKSSIKRFMPVAILASLMVTIVFEIAYVSKWWIVIEKITPWDNITSVPLVYGPFLIGTIWIFHFTFSKSFWVYILTNLLIDCVYTFVIFNVLIYMGIYKLINMSHFGILILMISIAVVIYAYQRWQDRIMKT
jgi:hypothetical protein